MPSSGAGAGTPAVTPADELVRRLATGGRALVALSGGVDSSVVALLAQRALGGEAIAVTLSGPAVAAEELEVAELIAARIGIAHEILTANPLADPRYVANPTDRCFFCRSMEAELLRTWGEAHGIRQYLDGVHVDDLGDDRPGLRAMDVAGFRHPLVEARWGKTDVRAFARSEDLPNWDRPSNACLASRIPHGERVTEELLRRVAASERWLSARGFRRVRVRVEGTSARVEVDPAEISRLCAEPMAGEVRSQLERYGFARVELDRAGYRLRGNA